MPSSIRPTTARKSHDPQRRRQALISAANDSVGVNLEDIEAIFDRYRVLDYFERKSERGLSFQGDLRLAICHSIVVRMHGEITVESTPNAQTTFTVLLPRLKVTAENTSRPQTTSCRVQTNTDCRCRP